LEKMRSGAAAAGIFVKSQPIDAEKLLEEWTPVLQNKWPSCVLFLDDEEPTEEE
jgi:hypothetical protein